MSGMLPIQVIIWAWDVVVCWRRLQDLRKQDNKWGKKLLLYKLWTCRENKEAIITQNLWSKMLISTKQLTAWLCKAVIMTIITKCFLCRKTVRIENVNCNNCGKNWCTIYGVRKFITSHDERYSVVLLQLFSAQRLLQSNLQTRSRELSFPPASSHHVLSHTGMHTSHIHSNPHATICMLTNTHACTLTQTHAHT